MVTTVFRPLCQRKEVVTQPYFQDSISPMQNSFFGFLSLLVAIYSGNTMALMYDRQRMLLDKVY